MKRKLHQAVAALLLGFDAAIGLYILQQFTSIRVTDPVEKRERLEAQVPEAERGAFGLYRHALDAVIGEYRDVLMRVRAGSMDSKLERLIDLGFNQIGPSMKDDTLPDSDGHRIAENFHQALVEHGLSEGLLGILVTDYHNLQAAEEVLAPRYDTVFIAENPIIFDYGTYTNPAHFAQFHQRTPINQRPSGGPHIIVYGDAYTKPHMQMLNPDKDPSTIVDPSDVDIIKNDILPSAVELRELGINEIVVGLYGTYVGVKTTKLPEDYDSHDGLLEYFADLESNRIMVSFAGVAER